MTYNGLDHRIQNLVGIILFYIAKTCESVQTQFLLYNRLLKLTEMKILSLSIDLTFLDKLWWWNIILLDVTATSLDNSLLNKISKSWDFTNDRVIWETARWILQIAFLEYIINKFCNSGYYFNYGLCGKQIILFLLLVF
jgi:hypothetical protein